MRGVGAQRRSIERSRVDVHADPGSHDIGKRDADEQCQRGEDLEIDHRLDADPTDFLDVASADDAMHHDAEHDRRDEHRDQLDEGIAEWLERLGEARRQAAGDDAKDQGNYDLAEQRAQKRAHGSSFSP